jgi:hypothetical protein
VSRWSPGDIAALGTFVSRGVSLLVFSGEHVRPDGYAPLKSAGLLPATVEGTAGPDSFRFAEWERAHPIFRPLSDPQQGDLRRIAFHHITRLKPEAEAKVLASAQTGDPLIVEQTVGQGKIIIIAGTADREWSDWAQSRLYVPFVHQVIGYLTDRLPETERVQTRPADREHAPGVAREGDLVIVRNLDPAESEIERYSPDRFRQVFHLPESNNANEQTGVETDALFPESQRPDEVWMYVVWILLILLIAEVFVANRATA